MRFSLKTILGWVDTVLTKKLFGEDTLWYREDLWVVSKSITLLRTRNPILTTLNYMLWVKAIILHKYPCMTTWYKIVDKMLKHLLQTGNKFGLYNPIDPYVCLKLRKSDTGYLVLSQVLGGIRRFWRSAKTV